MLSAWVGLGECTRLNAPDGMHLTVWNCSGKPAKSSRLASEFPVLPSSLAVPKTSHSKRKLQRGRILNLLKQELPIPGFSSAGLSALAPLGTYPAHMSGMRSRLVRPLPILHSNAGCFVAERNPFLCSLRKTSETRNARGLAPH